ncbi:zinc ribbon domain-containing protein [Endozoicomonas sp. G2_2]|uniref:FmdB family zinc ribbon protein n=1 Tax=Gammaproteobacteria TaxID=1236 RepID=UPI000C65A6B9|nr:zinc ribbon domain-containing protein [Salinisphaera sp.]MAS10612.1 FmdB family transcriptional regulator [Salinisphaera sp.]MBO9470941.1 zinc ribbon domain-containing protein [Endozoicomonas sp. G2_2]|tara:strand:- start:639 stop:998 length:360 start_codon:yes stop_codon:yes gene_type:complete
MPIYEYVCRSCGHELEQLQRLSDDPLTQCPECAEPQLKRKISAAGFRLSGGGWYETDFKSDGKRNLAGSDDKSGTAGSASKKEGASTSKASDTASKKADKPKEKKAAKADSKPASNTNS